MGNEKMEYILKYLVADTQLRILSQCYKDGDCLRFPYGHNRSGYGQISVARRSFRTHRMIYQLHHGIILEPDQYVCHTCDVRDCCNIDHLFIGTAAENMADKMTWGRHKVARGQNHGKTKLTDDQVREMKILYRDGSTVKELSHKYGMAVSGIYDIVRYNKIWKHITI